MEGFRSGIIYKQINIGIFYPGLILVIVNFWYLSYTMITKLSGVKIFAEKNYLFASDNYSFNLCPSTAVSRDRQSFPLVYYPGNQGSNELSKLLWPRLNVLASIVIG